ncbi:SRP40, C-terminal domain-containing protein [Annulohypoxylon maeteangense]|uniref:SRP40, C-terminal domain-containing protein n=1 Tax=Annulohypoxylon maeteangense TaxID=1927788 RepID=UPI002007D254|nr:SRP40, C-terminal domain-containing protein [Annulohypoxylon maeteangense]KAI0888358.1 SRP40, C-terminal domain-containing protein [Annulohypoxylon maeteangense]
MTSNSRTIAPSTLSQRPPAWLFTNNSTKLSKSVPSDDTTPTMAKKSQKAVKPTTARAPAASSSTSASGSQVPPTQLMDLVESFLSDQGFSNAHREFQKQRAKKGWKEQSAEKKKDKEHHSLVSVFQTWKTFASQGNTPVLVKDDPLQKITKVSSSSSESESSDSSSSESESDSDDAEDVAMADAPVAEESSSSESSSSEDSDSDSESDSEEEEKAKPATKVTGAAKSGANPLKRKAESDSESSSESDSDSADSDSEDERPQAKKAKTSSSSDESSSSESSDSSEDDSSSDEDEAKPKATKPKDDDSSSSDSDSDSDESDSDSDEEPEVDLKVAAEVPLPESDSSSSESDSDSDSDDEKPQQPTKGAVVNGTESDTSATLDKVSPEFVPAPLPPDPTLKSNNRGKNGTKAPRTQNTPFSRIRQDVTVDPRLTSNAYVTHGYGEKAHQDLIVTKGKGFTKEKNKKKRGSYKGGPLDINTSRSIKFDD